ncbi:MAG TPA: alpha/beta hydrolase [Ktedonobacteraceae bacterium]|jgi:pimeloyl-ACP methyl ester carboxylesterase
MKKITSKDGTTIAFEQLGEGPALILVDGALCYRTFGPMEPLSALLTPHFTVFTYDRRGRGESADTTPYTVEREIEDIAALIAEAGGSASVFGISSGAVLALEATASGLAITRLAIYEPPFINDASQRQQSQDDGTKLGELLAAGQRGAAIELFMTMAGTPAEMISQMRGAPMWPALEALAPTLAYDMAIMGHSSGDGSLPVERLATITIPTLVMSGGASPAGMTEGVQQVARALLHGQYRPLAEQTHNVAPQVLAPVLIEFFKS